MTTQVKTIRVYHKKFDREVIIPEDRFQKHNHKYLLSDPTPVPEKDDTTTEGAADAEVAGTETIEVGPEQEEAEEFYSELTGKNYKSAHGRKTAEAMFKKIQTSNQTK